MARISKSDYPWQNAARLGDFDVMLDLICQDWPTLHRGCIRQMANSAQSPNQHKNKNHIGTHRIPEVSAVSAKQGKAPCGRYIQKCNSWCIKAMFSANECVQSTMWTLVTKSFKKSIDLKDFADKTQCERIRKGEKQNLHEWAPFHRNPLVLVLDMGSWWQFCIGSIWGHTWN